MKIVASFSNLAKAELFRSFLEGSGIKATVLNPNMGSIAPWQLGTSGINVGVVNDTDLARAKDALADFESNEK